jgi:hypothetical protein
VTYALEAMTTWTAMEMACQISAIYAKAVVMLKMLMVMECQTYVISVQVEMMQMTTMVMGNQPYAIIAAM